MLWITIPSQEFYDEQTNRFINTKAYRLQLEHSLVSISKWEANWCKPFLVKAEKTEEETQDYVRCMTITQNIPDEAYKYLTPQNIKEVNAYIEAPRTATKIYRNNRQNGGRKQTVTSELIYYWMTIYNIPPEYQKWHLNRLLTLLEICEVHNAKQKPRSTNDILRSNRELNAARRAKMHSKG